MKNTNLLMTLLVCVVLFACGGKTHENEGHGEMISDADSSSGNRLLYDKVMKVHNEVMPKLDDIYSLKEKLKNKIANTPSLSDAQKKEIDLTISQLDSASENMMVWMRKFNPPPDSLGEEKAREYLESEMEKVQKVKADILESIEKATMEN
ncbi:hypothetical protein [Chryseolinea lacunae]|uniref:Viral A-type inclusion protein n=1 Tax=Chryseolinea lacunae TaxID=2801331 RepID=A0ABS1KSV1_9BACT|nr:hypothetical protein [Chryseolinea lacunae]MBL0742511.1 hypothetical protein [Chryseolinea lacunae]